MAEHLTQVVVVDLPEICRLSTKAGHPTHRVRRRTSAHLHRRSKCVVQLLRTIGVDQIHPALDQAVLFEKRVGRVRDHVDESIADTDHIEPLVGSREAPIEVDGHERARYLGRSTR